jgi:hypothetical protein
LQYGIRAIVAPSFGRIFYSNAMNNQLLLAPVPQAGIDGLLADVVNPLTNWVTIDIQECSVRSRNHLAQFSPLCTAPADVCRGARPRRCLAGTPGSNRGLRPSSLDEAAVAEGSCRQYPQETDLKRAARAACPVDSVLFASAPQ